MSLVTIENLYHSYGDYPVFKNADLSLYKGEHMGVVGPNGAGKSTLIGILTGATVPDSGRVDWHPGLTVGYLDQYAVTEGPLSIADFLWTAFDDIRLWETEMQRAYEAYAADGDDAHLWRAADLQARLEGADYYGVQTRIDKTAEGLGLRAIGMDRALDTLSGGQRAKVILARLLLRAPDVLILDEPTNFLDRAHIDWLAAYLQDFAGAFMVVSHDDAFLECIANCICVVGHGGIEKFHGTYAACRIQMEQSAMAYRSRYAAQQREIARTESYIRKNIAGVNTRIAQGRRKRLERLERLEAPKGETLRPVFHFRTDSSSVHQLLDAEGVVVGYDCPLLPPQNLSLRRGEKLVIIGGNGIGKSTLLKTLIGKHPALAGRCGIGDDVAVGYFEQILGWPEPGVTPLQLVRDAAAQWDQNKAYAHLARTGVSREHAGQAIATLSGGEQAKVKLGLLSIRAADLLALDEPTNHLDTQAKKALKEALQAYEGGLILVSHEPEFYGGWVDRVIDLSR